MPEKDQGIGVLSCNDEIVDWFLDVIAWAPIRKDKQRKHLDLPSKLEIEASARLIGLNHTRKQYDGLLTMIIEAKKHIR